MRITLIICVLFFLTINGCISVFQATQIKTSENRLSPSIKLDNSAVLAFHAFPKIDDIKFVYLISSSNFNDANYSKMMHDFLKQLGFTTIFTTNELISKMAEEGHDTVITNLRDKLQLRKLNKLIGPFLVVSSSCNLLAKSWWRHMFYIYDPE